MPSSPTQKILLAEDDPGIVRGLELLLEEEGYQLMVTNNGDGFQEKVTSYLPDLILLDLWLGGANGAKLAKGLKADPNLNQIPIIIISADNDTERIAKEAGANDFLAKPFGIDELMTTIELHLSSSS